MKWKFSDPAHEAAASARGLKHFHRRVLRVDFEFVVSEPLRVGLEEQFEDVPHDMKSYIDSEGNLYDFAFGLNWKGTINDDRVKKYKK